ncbi:AbrB/MazE/SpoVT family DNA-binding domain-containing protein [Ammonifex thiophilus]|uniref:AbrB/MazE/SpoVT family DNA-binding domain-containing protein n=1 Tax=Ammonifex thiophilus TaxID=444093 RepID=A0A3D8P4B4_9THEO|nr:AbrB/MazE/SpoVT family DNA-binding domain-containing protein [Ammonifex thiophilus]RDV82049.1 AbrB/MazE/SpoVT family DNA-binding domain-containing protein [Ammonifex thiophilus]
MFARLSKKGQITLPAEVRRLLKLRPGARVRFVLEENAVRLLPVEGGIESLKGAVKVDAPQDFKAVRHRAMEERSREEASRA